MFERSLVGLDRTRKGALIRMNGVGVCPGDDGVLALDRRWPDHAVALGWFRTHPVAVVFEPENTEEWPGARGWFSQLDGAQTELLSTALQVASWQRDHRFCGRCGHEMRRKPFEFAMVCPSCRFVSFPRISPCIITLITRGDALLLARSPRFSVGRFSTLAGFIEPGETVEAAVRREVMEEVGVRVGEVEYFGSQSWPFPHSLMMGFYGEALSEEITIDGVEIEAADWFYPDQLPGLPPSFSIARALIDNFIEGR
ncbi:NAD(+) diphosphatase [Larsenimonas suaedae]|uniref:NAD(+) diphosphatase n=1 Tax=Larsenimonas suaedae TaxID=1851019 RepID=A0ABU1GX12_9GAMM|nr:NAD(+) diphosphatase [Larsenimonas suaedae]MCM2971268.1 NAD(+) diphosphatase [Larsenimonas suaedae]MDR5895977.1 NAD(+) diphosphatase [Larsenimonas suaedae]